jgi:hypothetical protein
MRLSRVVVGLVGAGVIGFLAFGLGRFLVPGPPRPSARETLLLRQNRELVKLADEAEKGTLADFKGALIVVDQVLVQDLLRAVMPVEKEVGGGFTVRIQNVDAAFGDGVALVRMTGRAGVGGTSMGSVVTVFAAIDVVHLDPASGLLQCGVSILGVEAENASALGRNDPVGRLTEVLTDGGLRLLVGTLEIPVSIDDRLEIPAVQSKRLQIPAETLPLSVTAKEVKAFGGRLWVFVDVALKTRPAPVPVPSPAVVTVVKS